MARGPATRLHRSICPHHYVGPQEDQPKNTGNAAGREEVLLPEMERQQRMGREVTFWADTGFVKSEVQQVLEAWDVERRMRVLADGPAAAVRGDGWPVD
jgi:hypothetical protein